MRYDFYFHGDLDGCAAAAIFLSFLRSRGDDVKNCFPVYHDIKSQWEKKNFKRPTAVFDFWYHPRAVFWFDHHGTTFINKEWKKRFKQSKFYHLNSEYLSCTHLVFDALVKNFGFKPPKHFNNLIKWLDIVDGAKYRSAKQTIEIEEPALRLNAFVDKKIRDPGLAFWLVKNLSERDINEIVKEKRVRRVVSGLKNKIAQAIKFYRKNLQVYGKVAYIDLSKSKILKIQFLAHYLLPDSVYSLILRKFDGCFILHVSSNPWKFLRFKINLGELMKMKYGGGGHKGAAATQIKSEKEAYKIVGEIIDVLKNN